MKRHLLVTTLMVSALAVQPALAVDAHHPDQPSGAAAPTTDQTQTIQKMQANTVRMQGQLEQMVKSKDPSERQKLMQEHMQTMQENMMAGKRMMGGMMDCPMMKGGMMGGGSGMGTDKGMAKRLEMMEKRIDMMQKNMGSPQGGPANPAK